MAEDLGRIGGKLVQVNLESIKGEKGTGFESRIVNGVDKGPFECANCEYFNGSCGQKDMMQKSKRPKLPNGRVKVEGGDCCEYIERTGENYGRQRIDDAS